LITLRQRDYFDSSSSSDEQRRCYFRAFYYRLCPSVQLRIQLWIIPLGQSVADTVVRSLRNETIIYRKCRKCDESARDHARTKMFIAKRTRDARVRGEFTFDLRDNPRQSVSIPYVPPRTPLEVRSPERVIVSFSLRPYTFVDFIDIRRIRQIRCRVRFVSASVLACFTRFSAF